MTARRTALLVVAISAVAAVLLWTSCAIAIDPLVPSGAVLVPVKPDALPPVAPDRIAGLVVDRDGRPVPDLQLRIEVAAVFDKSMVPRCRTDAAGRFEFTDVGDRPVNVQVDPEDAIGDRTGARRRYWGQLERVRRGNTELRLVVALTAEVRLRLVDGDTDRPVLVYLAEYGLRDEGAPEPEHLPRSLESSEAFESVEDYAECGRRYDLTVRCPDFDVARVNGIEVGDVNEMDVRVPMRRAK